MGFTYLGKLEAKKVSQYVLGCILHGYRRGVESIREPKWVVKASAMRSYDTDEGTNRNTRPD